MTLLEPTPRLLDPAPSSALDLMYPIDVLAQSARLTGAARGRFDAGQFLAFLSNERRADEQTNRLYSLSDIRQKEEHDGFIEVLEVEAPDFTEVSVGDERIESLGRFAGREVLRQLVVEEYGQVVCYAALSRSLA